MRKLAATLLLLLGPAACSYTDPNPWDTSDDIEEYREKTEDNWKFELREPRVLPQAKSARLTDGDLEAWRDTVLANADPATVRHIRTWNGHKLDWLKAEISQWYKVDKYNRRVPLSELLQQYRVEMIRAQMLDAREKQLVR